MTTTSDRLHALDAVRGFALLAGVVLHAAMSFLPGFDFAWPLADRSPSTALGLTFFVIHVFRMTLFFTIAGFFAHLLYHKRGARAFIRNRALRIVVPLVVGWIVVMPLIVVAFAWAGPARGTVPADYPPLEMPPLAFPLTHLWFLYVLAWLYAAVLIAREVFVRSIDPRGAIRAGVDRAVHGLAVSFAAPIVLAIPVFVAMISSPLWVRWFGITTPDQSLIPNMLAAAAFTTAFAFGWLADRQRGLLEIWQRQWPVHLVVAVAATAACVWIAGPVPVFRPAPIDDVTRAYAGLYAIASWTWTFAIIGIALRFFAGDSPRRRYVSDASYWIYIMHLPIVFLLQAAMMNLPWHWSIKFVLIVSVATLFLFATYHLFVRRTFIGEVLNGRRHTPGSGGTTPPNPSPGSHPHAELIGARKQYDKTVALDGVDIELRRGELLAVLGPNGAGKSTAISLMLGLLEPDAGEARLFGRPPQDIEARYGIGVMMQEVALGPELKVRELVDLTARYYPSPLTVDEALRLTATIELRDRPYGKLSTGQKRQVQFALAICGRPAVLFLDEPTVGLDVTARDNFWATIRRLVAEGVSIVLTTHYLEEAEALADRVVVLANGRVIASGSVDEIRRVVDRKRIRCKTTMPIEAIRSWPGVVDARLEGEPAADPRPEGAPIVIVTTEADAVARRLLIEDATARDLEVQRAGLAEAFAALTKEAA